MFLRLHTIRAQGGKAYTYLEIVFKPRRDGGACQERVCSLGRVEELQQSGVIDRTVAKLAQVARGQWARWDAQGVGARWCKDYGPVLLTRGLWQGLGLGHIIHELGQRHPVEVPLEEALLALVANRLWQAPAQRDIPAWLRTKVYAPGWETLELEHLYRSLDFLAEHMRTVEDSLLAQAQGRRSQDGRWLLFPLNGHGPVGLAARGYPGGRQLEQGWAVMGVLTMGEGVPVAYYLFPGPRVEGRAFGQMWGDLRERFPEGWVVVVAERGVAAESLFRALEQEGLDYVEGLGHDRGEEDEVLQQGRHPEAMEELQAKEIWLEGRRYLLRIAPKVSVEEAVQAYGELGRVGAAFRDLRSGLEQQPRYPWTSARSRGYIGVCFLALVLESALQRMLRNRGCQESMREVLDAVQEVKAVRVEVAGQAFLARTELPYLATQAFAAAGISPPPPVCPLAEERGSAMALPKE